MGVPANADWGILSSGGARERKSIRRATVWAKAAIFSRPNFPQRIARRLPMGENRKAKAFFPDNVRNVYIRFFDWDPRFKYLNA